MGWALLKILLLIISIENLVHRIRTESHTWPLFYVLSFGYLFKSKDNGDSKDSG